MKLYLDTSTPVTVLKLDKKIYEWTSNRDLACNLLSFIHNKLIENGKDWGDLSSLTFMTGPGSFTGLRIGATVLNTLADTLGIPLYDHRGNQHKILLPEYGRPANITRPTK